MEYLKLLMGVAFFFFPLSYVRGASKNLSTPKQTEHLSPKQEQEPLTPQQVQQMLPPGCCGCWYYKDWQNWIYANCYVPKPIWPGPKCMSTRVAYYNCASIGFDGSDGSASLTCIPVGGGEATPGDFAENGAAECGPPDNCNNVCYSPPGTYPPPSSSNTSKSHLISPNSESPKQTLETSPKQVPKVGTRKPK